MKTLTLSAAKMKLSELIAGVQATDEAVIITKNGSPAVVLVSLGEFESWRETLAVRSDAALMSEIKSSLKALKAKQGRLYTLEDLLSSPVDVKPSIRCNSTSEEA